MIAYDNFMTFLRKSSTNYLDKQFSELLKGCSSEKQRLIYDIAKVIAESDNNDD